MCVRLKSDKTNSGLNNDTHAKKKAKVMNYTNHIQELHHHTASNDESDGGVQYRDVPGQLPHDGWNAN